ncbi:hypothetical protein [Bacillus cereus]|nr:hypothetical protein [Bacillus cereus]
MATRKQISKERSAAYRWLIKNDRVWFEKKHASSIADSIQNIKSIRNV